MLSTCRTAPSLIAAEPPTDSFAAFYGPQSRVMDGVLARANCLLITSLWVAFKFEMVPIGAKLTSLFPPSQFAVLIALIWGSYIVADALAEVGGALSGKQQIRVRGIGAVNRKSIGGTVSGFVGCLAFCLWIVQAHGLPTPWLALAAIISVSNTLLELFSPRGTDDDRDFFVYTPPGYDARRSQPYPVLYLLHGLGDDAARWMNGGAANHILDNLIAQRKAVPMIVVTPLGYGTSTGPAGG